jgi:hypothetical protein
VDVHLVRATRYAALDRIAMQMVAAGHFPAPADNSRRGGHFSIPVCYGLALGSAALHRPDAPTDEWLRRSAASPR